MPRIVDKIIINDGVLRSFRRIIRGYFEGVEEVMEGGETLGREIEHWDWATEPDALDFLKDQESDCAVVDAACHLFITQLAEFHKKQMIRNDAMRLWIDKMLASQKPPTP